jgi:hypothetical protein
MTPVSSSRIEFNTITHNRANNSFSDGTSGIYCNAPFAIRNNIVFDNETSDLNSLCSSSNSLIDEDPKFRMSDFIHLRPESKARGAGDPASLADPRFQCDIDDDLRTNPPDIGADQVR